jgi:hypothetical protein
VSTLHASAVINAYASDCRRIRTMWGAWTAAVREQAFRSVYQSLCQRARIPVPQLVFKSLGDLGSFSWGNWSITVDNKRFKKALSKDEFVDLCCTVYHETRHSEQFFRVAQGLFLKRFDFPGKLPQGANLRMQVGSALNIPPTIASQADIDKAGYNAFAASPKLPHCTTGSGPGWSNWDPTVSDWLERTYSKSKQRFAERGQSAPSGTAIDRAWYRGAEDERDAFAVEELVKAALKPMIT